MSHSSLDRRLMSTLARHPSRAPIPPGMHHCRSTDRGPAAIAACTMQLCLHATSSQLPVSMHYRNACAYMLHSRTPTYLPATTRVCAYRLPAPLDHFTAKRSTWALCTQTGVILTALFLFCAHATAHVVLLPRLTLFTHALASLSRPPNLPSSCTLSPLFLLRAKATMAGEAPATTTRVARPLPATLGQAATTTTSAYSSSPPGIPWPSQRSLEPPRCRAAAASVVCAHGHATTGRLQASHVLPRHAQGCRGPHDSTATGEPPLQSGIGRRTASPPRCSASR